MYLKRLNDLRIDNDLSIAQLAREINVPARNLQYYLKRQYDILILILIDLVEYFQVSFDYVFFRTDKKEINK